MYLRFGCLLLALSLQAHATADAPDDAALNAARAQLAQFNGTSPYLSDAGEDKERNTELQSACTNASMKPCIDYLRHNRLQALQGMPNNPAYWRHMLAYFETVPVGPAAGEYPFPKDEPRHNVFGLLEAVQIWPWYDLAVDGEIDSVALTSLTGNLRRFRAQSSTLMERILFVAGHGIMINWSNVAMAEAAARYDQETVARLQRGLVPMTPEERPYDRIVVTESSYATAWGEAGIPDIDTYRVQYGDDVSGHEYEQEMKRLQGYLEHLPVIVEMAVEMGQTSDARFWQYGLQWPPQDEDNPVPPEVLDLLPYESYIGTEISANVSHYVLQGLADIYAGVASPGLPARPPPAGWRWVWRSDTEMLCLEGIDLHPDVLSQVQDGMRCHEYLAPDLFGG